MFPLEWWHGQGQRRRVVERTGSAHVNGRRQPGAAGERVARSRDVRHTRAAARPAAGRPSADGAGVSRPRVALPLVAGPDFDTEIKQLQATMKTIGQVLDLDAMRAEIADLGEQVAAPDLWDDQDNATRVTGRLSLLQGELDRFTELRGRIEDLELMVELGREEGDAETLAEAERELGQDPEGRREPRGPHPAVRRVRRPRGAGHDPLRRRRRRRRRLRRDADADVHPLGRAAQVPRRGLRHLLRRGGRASSRPPSPSTRRTPTAPCRSRPAPTGWCGSARSTTRAAARPASPRSRWCRCSSRPTRSRSPTRTSGSTSTAPAVPAASRSTPPTPRSGSPTSRPAWS